MARPTSTTKFVANPLGIAELAVNPQLQAALKEKAEAAAEAARNLAAREAHDTGAYEHGIEGVAGIEDGRAIGRVIANDYKSHWIEWGTVKMMGRHILTRGAEAVGLHVTSGKRRR